MVIGKRERRMQLPTLNRSSKDKNIHVRSQPTYQRPDLEDGNTSEEHPFV
jgi:hypothetical protein